MKRNKIYIAILLIIAIGVSGALWYKNDIRIEKAMIKEIIYNAGTIKLMKDAGNDTVIKDDFPAIEKVYSVGDTHMAFIVSGTGYEGIIKTLVIVSNEMEKIAAVRILEQGDTPLYADGIKEFWFTDRFNSIGLTEYLNRVVLDPKKPSDIVQVTGASITSQAALNNVNSAIGAWNYLFKNKAMDPVDNFISQEMWQKDENSFQIVWPENKSMRITVDDLEEYTKVDTETILAKTNGVRENITATGVLLKDILKKNNINVTIRREFGSNVKAACGQLRSLYEEE